MSLSFIRMSRKFGMWFCTGLGLQTRIRPINNVCVSVFKRVLDLRALGLRDQA